MLKNLAGPTGYSETNKRPGRGEGSTNARVGRRTGAGGVAHSGSRCPATAAEHSCLYWMVHKQPPEGCEPQSSSLCTERPSEGSYSTTCASGARFSMSLQLTVRRRRGSTPPLLVRSTPLGCPSCPAGGCCGWCAAWLPAAAAAAFCRSSAATAEGEAKVRGPSEVLLLAALGGRGSACCAAPPPDAAAAPAAAAACGWPAAAAGAVPAASLMAGLGRGGLPPRGGPPGGEAPRGGEAPNGEAPRGGEAPNGEAASGGEPP